MDEGERRAFDKRSLLVGGHMLSKLVRVNSAMRNGDRVVEVKIARTPVIVEAVGDVDVLLEFEQFQAAADRVDRPGRDIEEVTAPNIPPVH